MNNLPRICNYRLMNMAALLASASSPTNLLLPRLLLRSNQLNRDFPLITPFPPKLQSQLQLKPVKQRSSFGPIAASGNPDAGIPKSVPVRVAHELLQAGHHYLDVRTEEEFNAGHVAGAVNIPYMFRAGVGMKKNPDFLEEVSSHFGKDVEIIVGCRSGKRSIIAATELSSNGFTGITDIAGGYSTWVQNGLPVE